MNRQPDKNEIMDELAERIAARNDEYARRRHNEMWSKPRKYPAGFIWFGIVCVAIGLSPIFFSCAAHH